MSGLPRPGRCLPSLTTVWPRHSDTGAPTVQGMTKWEYASVPLLVHATKQILDTWGEDGWELISVVPGPAGSEQLVAFFKRESA